jgi:hypothetical protein
MKEIAIGPRLAKPLGNNQFRTETGLSVNGIDCLNMINGPYGIAIDVINRGWKIVATGVDKLPQSPVDLRPPMFQGFVIYEVPDAA